jgi:hypothetical protein
VPFSTSSVVQGALGPWEGKPRRVRLVFDPESAHLVAERSVHPTQRSQWRSDGRLDVEIRVPVCPPVVTWVLGFGSAVTVLGPVELARRVDREHSRSAARVDSSRRPPLRQGLRLLPT